MQNVVCTGDEQVLQHCKFEGFEDCRATGCNHENDVTVACYKPDPSPGDVFIYPPGVSETGYGVVMVYYNNSWVSSQCLSVEGASGHTMHPGKQIPCGRSC